MRIKIYSIAAFVFCISVFQSKAQDIAATTSLVYPGADGRLVYVADSLGNKIPDFSNAGYKGGGVPIPQVQPKVIVWPLPGDNSDYLQKVIDSISALPLDPSGFRGTILLKKGIYNLEKPITIKASGVVLRGEGMNDIGTILFGKTPKQIPGQGGRGGGGRQALVNIAGATAVKLQEETKQTVTDSYVPVGAVSFNVVSAKAFKKGDKVLIR